MYIEKHLLEMAHHRAFLPGQRDKSLETGQGMARFLEDWEKRWKEMSGDQNNNGDIASFILTYNELIRQRFAQATQNFDQIMSEERTVALCSVSAAFCGG